MTAFVRSRTLLIWLEKSHRDVQERQWVEGRLGTRNHFFR